MKTYRKARELQAKIEQMLLRPPSPGSAPLDEVAEILSSGRHYDWIGIYLLAGAQPATASSQEDTVRSASSGNSRVIPIRLGQHVYGAIEVRAEAGKGLASEDRILLKSVAARLARYLHGPGAALVRKAREAAAAEPESPPARGYQPESERAQPRSLAAGEGRR
ncbi:MAG TPA: hypothetical protein VFU27_10035 [Terriglobales bacterium]|nr:hypothetical protein [Terriglobales bacterium]